MRFPFLKSNFENTRNEFVIIANSCIGDGILVSSLVQNIKRLYANSKVIIIVTSEKIVDFLKLLDGVDDVFFWDRKGRDKGYIGIFNFIKKFPYKNIHTVFPLYNYGRPIIFAHLLKPNYVVTSSERLISTLLMKNKYFLKHKLKENVQLNDLNLLKGITKENLINLPIKINLPNINSKIVEQLKILTDYIALCPISSKVTKDMPFEVVKNLIHNSQKKVILLGAGEQATELSKYLQKKNTNNYVDLLNKTNLTEAGHIIKNAMGVISVDTGLLHIACAFDKKIVEIIYDNNYEESYLPDTKLYDVNILFNEQNSKLILSKLQNIQEQQKNIASDTKIDLIFDADIIANGAIKNASRTGIYVAAYNIFKEFIKNDNINLKLYCNLKKLAQLDMFLDDEFKDTKFEIISEVPNNFITTIYKYFLKNRTIAKERKQKLKKFYYDIFTRLMKILLNIQKVFYYNTFITKLHSGDAYFSCMTAFPDFVKNNNNIQKYLILHDCIPLIIPKCHPDGSKKGSWYDKLINSINDKDNYFVNSECTKKDFMKYCPRINPDKITTTLLACNDNFKPKSDIEIKKVKEKYKVPLGKKYVFSLCTLEPRKNLIRTVKTFIEFIKKNNIDDLIFVMGGGNWKIFINQLEQEIQNLGEYKDKILKIGYVDDEDLSELYSGAEWFTYTSQYEGFGLPPLEAMSCGCPVITSNNSSLPEVIGDAGIMIDWDSDEQHIKAYEKYYYDKNYKKEMAQKGLERTKQFSWKKCADKMIEVMIQNKYH